MSNSKRRQRTYDHRLKELVRSTGNIDVALQRGVPRSTARGWLTKNMSGVITVDVLDMSLVELQRDVVALRRRNARLIALLRLIITVMKVTHFTLSQIRLPQEAQKLRVLQAIEYSRKHFPLKTVLRVIGLSHGRYREWKRVECGLDDLPSCPRSSPHQLTAAEMRTIQEMVTSEKYRHVATGTLARLAERMGKMFASPSTWYRLVRIHKWRRVRSRVYPAKPKVGIRAIRANEIWHVDTSLVRLVNGGRAYIHAVIDNYSRRILAWRVLDRFEPGITARLFLDVSQATTVGKPTVFVDGGRENYNAAIDEVIESGLLKRVLAQTKIQYSNSLIESWWRVLKHQWLYFHELDSAQAVENLVAFYVEQYNTYLPHSAFQGQTPDEMYYGTGQEIPGQLQEARIAARKSRMESNRSQSCRMCEELLAVSN
ncbi:DDE-type integrase/transposase/recombinase [Gimesia sp.]|uniref:DDE-type integrase/transposase/recombinase n=1 Tax=Gimesia sp. TaxID=2024833 RepID=UPI0032EB09B6